MQDVTVVLCFSTLHVVFGYTKNGERKRNPSNKYSKPDPFLRPQSFIDLPVCFGTVRFELRRNVNYGRNFVTEATARQQQLNGSRAHCSVQLAWNLTCYGTNEPHRSSFGPNELEKKKRTQFHHQSTTCNQSKEILACTIISYM